MFNFIMVAWVYDEIFSGNMSKNPLLPFVRVSVLLIALLALLVGYYWVHKPFDITLVMRAGGVLLDLGAALALFAAGGVIGRRVLPVSGGMATGISVLVGVGLISVVSAAAALIGIFQPRLLWAILAFILVIRWRDLRAMIEDIRAALRSSGEMTPFDRALGVLVIVLLAASALTSLAAPYAWDSMTYHLVGANRLLNDGGFRAHADNFFLGFPQFTETLYALVIGLFGRASAAAPVHFLFGGVGVWLTAGVTRRVLGSGGILAAALMLSAYSLGRLFGWAYVDLTVMAYSIGALAVLIIAAERPRTSLIGIAGLLLGFAVSAKYIAGVWAVAMLAYLLVTQKPEVRLRYSVLLTFSALAAFAVWMIKGLLLYGNPIYPYLFGGLMWDAARNEAFNLVGNNLIASGRAWHLPVMPIAATIFGIHDGEGYSFSAGAWLLTLPYLLPFVWTTLDVQARSNLKRLLIPAALVLIGWAVLAALSGIAAQTRMMVMAFPLAALFGAAVLEGLPRKPVDVRFIVRMIVLVTLVLHTVDVLRELVADRVAAYHMGLIDDREYLYTRMGAHHPALADLAAHVPAGSQVRLMWEPRSFYCPPTITCLPDVMFDHWRRPLRMGMSADQVFEQYRAVGDDYWLVWSSGYELDSADPSHAPLNQEFTDALERYMTPIWTDGFYYTLYSWQQP